jgi:glycerophosphoryl diester phosphodiesterase
MNIPADEALWVRLTIARGRSTPVADDPRRRFLSLILGHRGLSTTHLENSLDAFRAALVAGMDGFELDVQPTRDGVCRVLYDETLERTASAGGILRQMKGFEVQRYENVG